MPHPPYHNGEFQGITSSQSTKKVAMADSIDPTGTAGSMMYALQSQATFNMTTTGRDLPARSDLPRNTKGGILIERDAALRAWDMLTMHLPEHQRLHAHLSVYDIRHTISALVPYTLREVEWILGKRDSVGFEQFYDLMKHNALEEVVDPVKEAFMELCPENEECFHLSKVKEMFEHLGTTGLCMEVMEKIYDKLLLEVTEDDMPYALRDNREVNLGMFRRLCSYGHAEKEEDDVYHSEMDILQR